VELVHEFTVPTSQDETWQALNDIESVAGCFPGATVTSVEGDTFKGTCKVKLGPIALVYSGSGEFTELDEAAHRMVVDAKGKDKRGNGTAGAHVEAVLTDEGGATRARVVTTLNITGKPAQFGRGVIQDVSDKLLGQFVDCLQGKVGAPPVEAAPPKPAPTESPGQAAGAPAAPVAAASPAAAAPGHDRAAPSSASDGTHRGAARDDALDLGAAVLPVVLKSYGKQVAVVLGGLLLVVLVLRRLIGRGGR